MPRGETRAFYCDPPLVGEYITINIRGSYQVLALCEVEVYLSELTSKFQEIHVIFFYYFIDNYQMQSIIYWRLNKTYTMSNRVVSDYKEQLIKLDVLPWDVAKT
jgi:hypothetical protein